MDTSFRLRRHGDGCRYVWYKHPPDWISTGTKDEIEARDLARVFIDEKPRSPVTLNELCTKFFIPGKCPYEKRQRARGRSFGVPQLKSHSGRLDNYILPQ